MVVQTEHQDEGGAMSTLTQLLGAELKRGKASVTAKAKVQDKAPKKVNGKEYLVSLSRCTVAELREACKSQLGRSPCRQFNKIDLIRMLRGCGAEVLSVTITLEELGKLPGRFDRVNVKTEPSVDDAGAVENCAEPIVVDDVNGDDVLKLASRRVLPSSGGSSASSAASTVLYPSPGSPLDAPAAAAQKPAMRNIGAKKQRISEGQ